MRAIVHVDGDAFFASCEVAQDERLRGRPVVTGQERGMAIAVSYEAKARGIARGMLMRDIRKLVPDVVILGGHYELYRIYSQRMCAIVRRYAPIVEEYSVDECFADISNEAETWEELVEIAHKIKNDLEKDLGMTFSLGLAPTKTLAKVASKCKKPAGFTSILEKDIYDFLKDLSVGKVWGIGGATSGRLNALGVKTALQFIQKSHDWVKEYLAKPQEELWYELNGIPMHEVGDGNMAKHKSIRSSSTFRPPSKDKHFILSELSKNAEEACHRLRKYKLQSKSVYFFLKTQKFMYYGKEIRFDQPITTPSEVINAIKRELGSVWRDTEYRTTGVVLQATSPESEGQSDLFGNTKNISEKNNLYKNFIDKSKIPITLASSLLKLPRRKSKERGEKLLDLGLQLGIPSWGETSSLI